jgi:hypothetical protein
VQVEGGGHPLLLEFAKLVPCDLPNRCILCSSACQIYNDNLLIVLSPRFAIDQLSQFTINVIHGHESSLNRPAKLSDFGRLLNKIGDVLGRLQEIIGAVQA